MTNFAQIRQCELGFFLFFSSLSFILRTRQIPQLGGRSIKDDDLPEKEIDEKKMSRSFLLFQQQIVGPNGFSGFRNRKKKNDDGDSNKKEKLKFKTKMRPGESFRSYSKRITKEKGDMLASLESASLAQPIREKRKQKLTSRKEKQRKKSGNDQDSGSEEEKAKFDSEKIEFNDIAERPPLNMAIPKGPVKLVTLNGIISNEIGEEKPLFKRKQPAEPAVEAQRGKKSKPGADPSQKRELDFQRTQAQQAYQLMKQRRHTKKPKSI
jgi:hypothetical protein